MKILRILGVPVAATVILVLGCTDAPSPAEVQLTSESYESPTVESSESLAGVSSESLSGDLLGTVEEVVETTTVTTVRRTRPVEGPATCAVETVGPRGGVMECEEAGLRVVFPRGALDEATEISIHIPDRNLVGYEFAPHGLEFEEDVELRQSLEDTELEENPDLLSQLIGAYVDEISAVTEALEILPAELDGSEEVTIRIRHFSGYICATN